MFKSLICLLALGGLTHALQAAETVLTMRAPETANDQRSIYIEKALRLALDKTIDSHGPYTLKLSDRMNKQRALVTAARRQYPNFVVMAGYEEGRQAGGLVPIKFPILFGAVGYRVCFVSPQAQQAVAGARSIAQLRRFSIGQGTGWGDVAVLRANGFTVTEVSAYENLFAMVAKGRIDLFCRSVLEVRHEALARADQPDLLLDRSFALVYDLPQFFHMHHKDRAVAQRIEKGLLIAYRDGSLLSQFRDYLQPSLPYVDLGKRRIFRLEAPPPKGLDFDYRQYDLDLTREKP